MRILVNETGIVEEDLQRVMEEAAAICIRGEELDPENVEISLSFVSADEIHALNREYRGVDRVTDVLSFPLIDDWDAVPRIDEEPDDEPEEDPDEGLDEASEEDPEELEVPGIPLGDVVICLEKAEEQAAEYGHSREREIVYLFVHSVLHLLGYDHMEEEEKREMRQREEEVMQAVDLPR